MGTPPFREIKDNKGTTILSDVGETYRETETILEAILDELVKLNGNIEEMRERFKGIGIFGRGR